MMSNTPMALSPDDFKKIETTLRRVVHEELHTELSPLRQDVATLLIKTRTWINQ
jgi:hypothetical protein